MENWLIASCKANISPIEWNTMYGLGVCWFNTWLGLDKMQIRNEPVFQKSLYFNCEGAD
jgi:hypothetical protein